VAGVEAEGPATRRPQRSSSGGSRERAWVASASGVSSRFAPPPLRSGPPAAHRQPLRGACRFAPAFGGGGRRRRAEGSLSPQRDNHAAGRRVNRCAVLHFVSALRVTRRPPARSGLSGRKLASVRQRTSIDQPNPRQPAAQRRRSSRPNHPNPRSGTRGSPRAIAAFIRLRKRAADDADALLPLNGRSGAAGGHSRHWGPRSSGFPASPREPEPLIV